MAERYPQFNNASKAFHARLVRAVRDKDISRKTADELADLHTRTLTALGDEFLAIAERAVNKRDGG
jgi:hypothetical protein